MLVDAARGRRQLVFAADTDRQPPCRPNVGEPNDGKRQSSPAATRRRLRDNSEPDAFCGHPADALEGAELDAEPELGANARRPRVDVILQGTRRQADKGLIEQVSEPSL